MQNLTTFEMTHELHIGAHLKPCVALYKPEGVGEQVTGIFIKMKMPLN